MMRAMDGHEVPGESVGSNRWYRLIRDDQGYRLHATGGGPDARFPDTDEGAERAWAEFRKRSAEVQHAHRVASTPRWLFGAVVASSVGWVVTGVFAVPGFFFSGRIFDESWFRWMQTANQILYQLLIGSLAVLIGWWAYRKLSAELSAELSRPG
jgi:hypothetical protein